MTKKELMQRVVDELPEEADWSDAIDRLLYIKGIERGLASCLVRRPDSSSGHGEKDRADGRTEPRPRAAMSRP